MTTPLLDFLAEAQESTPWLVEGLIVEGELVMSHGSAHSGKTYMVVDIGMHIAMGRPDWHGFRIIGGARPVLYVPSEGRRGVARRLGSWLRVHQPNTFEDQVEPEWWVEWVVDHKTGEPIEVRVEGDAPDVPFYRYEGPPAPLPFLRLDGDDPKNARSREALKATVRALRAEHNAMPVVIIDVVGDFASGADENSREFGHAVKAVHPEVIADGLCTTLVVHHEGWTASGRPRGHSSLDGLVDSRLALDAKSDGGDDRAVTMTQIRVRNPKQRNEDRAAPFILTLTKPIPGLVNPVITGRVAPASLEAATLRGWDKRSSGQSDPVADRAPDDPNQLTAEEETFRLAAIEVMEETGKEVILMKEVLNVAPDLTSTTAGRRKAGLVEKGAAVKDATRGRGGFRLISRDAANPTKV